jgi:glycosyltransferase involved in cell wall biosynthesis
MSKDKIKMMFIIDRIFGLYGTEKYLLNFVERLDKERFMMVIVSLDQRDKIAEKFYKLGIPIIKLPIKKMYLPHSFMRYIKLYCFIKRYKIDIIETIHRTSDFIGPIIGRLAGVKVVISNRRDMGFMRTKKDDIVYRIVDRFVDRIKCNTKAATKHFSQLEKVPISKFDVSYNGVEIKKYDISEYAKKKIKDQYGIKENEIVVGVLGGVKEVKGHIEFLEMAKILSQTHDNIKFLVVGGGIKASGDEHFDYIKNLSIDKGLEAKVIFTGFIKDIVRILPVFDIAILPSYTEGCSNVLLEYMASEKPVIATNVGGNPELVVDGVTGFLVPPQNAYILAEKVNILLHSGDYRQKMGEKGLDRIKVSFEINNIVNQAMKYYAKLLWQFDGGKTNISMNNSTIQQYSDDITRCK